MERPLRFADVAIVNPPLCLRLSKLSLTLRYMSLTRGSPTAGGDTFKYLASVGKWAKEDD